MGQPVVPSSPVATTGETLTVGCKLPNGIMLQLYELRDVEIERPDGTVRPIKKAFASSEAIKLNGCAKFRGGGKETLHDIRNGAGLTFGVPADLFRQWIRENADAEYIKRGLVFAHKSNDIQAQSKDHVSLRSGLEPLNQADLPAEFKGKIEKATS